MSSDKIKYLADFILTVFTGAIGAGDNYKQFPLPLAIVVCFVALGVVGLLLSAGIMILVNTFF